MAAADVGLGVRFDDELLLSLNGLIDGHVAPTLHTRLTEAVDDGARYVVIDLAGVPAIDGGGQAVLAAAADRLRAVGGMLLLTFADREPAPVADASALRELFG